MEIYDKQIFHNWVPNLIKFSQIVLTLVLIRAIVTPNFPVYHMYLWQVFGITQILSDISFFVANQDFQIVWKN